MEQLITDGWFWVPIAFWAGWKISELWQVVAFKSLLNDLNVKQQDLKRLHSKLATEADKEVVDQSNHLPVLEVRIEQHPEGLFAYRKADNTFIAQGKDREALMDNLVNNLSNVRVVVAKEDGAELISP
jgi:hypothetical protein